ncbi:MAG: ABC-2 transporter permease [Gemmatimonadales bacterium]
MNTVMVKHLMLKDWYLLRPAILAYLLMGAVATILLQAGSEGAFYAGSVLLITVVMAVGFHMVMLTVVTERTEHTLPFVMSLPISLTEYTAAKILANVLIFLVSWLVLLLGPITVIAVVPEIPDGLIPFIAVIMGEIFVNYCLLLAVALVTESQGWAIGVMITGNLGFQAFLYWVSHLPGVDAANKSVTLVWHHSIVLLLVAEVVVILLLLGLTFLLQGRKRDFVV